MNEREKKIILIAGASAPKFEGLWTVREVIAMSDALNRWVQSLQVSPSFYEEEDTQGE